MRTFDRNLDHYITLLRRNRGLIAIYLLAFIVVLLQLRSIL